METTLKEKCKTYQKNRDYSVDTDKFIIVHIDGRSFSKMVKNKFKKPFDENFINMMNETAKYLCASVQGVQLAYVQSDEITLVVKKLTEKSEVFFNGRLCKMHSIISSLATSKFNQLMMVYNINNYEDFGCVATKNDVTDIISKMPLYQFDCKVWDVDNANDAMAWLLFRNIDCVRNSKQQVAQTYIPHKDLLNLNSDKQISLLNEREGIDWNDFKEGEKYGRLIHKEEYEKTVIIKKKDGSTVEETCTRSEWVALDGMDLTDENNRNKIKELYPIFE